jgi:hypothetical protein
MTPINRMLIGCLGALAPILTNLLIVDLQTVIPNITFISAISYALRLAALCAAACIVVFLNRDEEDSIKLFQLGVAAPALLTGMLNGAVIANQKSNVPIQSSQSTQSAPVHSSERDRNRYLSFEVLSGITIAHAQDAASSNGILDCTKPPSPTIGQQILKGLVGITPDNEWFVVVGSNPSADSALDDVKLFDKKLSGKFAVRVCAPAGGPDNRYRVVVGQYLTYDNASQLKAQAIAAGAPPDTWVWNPILRPQ